MDGSQRQRSRITGGTAGFLRSRSSRAKLAVREAARKLPPLEGPPIRIRFLRDLSVAGRMLHSGTGRGTLVHAASYLSYREMVLDRGLLEDPPELRRILIHETFHFVWRRLNNAQRGEWESLLRAEFREGAAGELGWSAESRKVKLTPRDARHRTTRWRHYVCESFCDSAAWLLGGGRHPEHTLPGVYRKARRRWLRALLATAPLSI